MKLHAYFFQEKQLAFSTNSEYFINNLRDFQTVIGNKLIKQCRSMASAWIALFVFLGEYKLPTDDFVVTVIVMYL